MNRLFLERWLVLLVFVLGLFSLAVVLASHNIADGDLWGKLEEGASVCLRGDVLRHDIFAFTPTLPLYIEHEWGAGTVFFALPQWFGPTSLQLLKIFLCFGALLIGGAMARKQNANWPPVFLFAIGSAACVLPAYIPVVRSHAFTFFFFAATVFLLEELKNKRWPAIALPLLMLVWANVHGGFVAGLGTSFVYAFFSILKRERVKIFLLVGLSCIAVTFINPYGIKFWQYLIPAVLHPRSSISEWKSLPLWASDHYVGFRIIFFVSVAVVALGWKHAATKNWPALTMLVITAFLAWRSRRHAPFFGITALSFVIPYFESVVSKFIPKNSPVIAPPKPLVGVTIIYGTIALMVSNKVLPNASLQPLAPVGHDAVREADILSLAKVKGNLATPFGWGCYLSWRLFPNIKISMDGRYETTYPESTFDLNNAFFEKHGDWQELTRRYKVDFVILDLQHEPLKPQDLIARGYVLIWIQQNFSALLCLPEHAATLQKAVQELPPTTIDPLNPEIPRKWWKS